MVNIILASKSPRRSELLSSINLNFSVLASDIDETAIQIKEPSELVKALAEAKAIAVCDKVKEPSLVIGSDTVVVYNGNIIGKPNSKEDAFATLSLLSGKQHEVYSGITIIDTINNRTFTDYEKTIVKMRVLTDYDINNYIATNEPMDKAGAYGIQGIGSILIEGIIGDYYSVMGLPIMKLYKGLNALDYNYFNLIKNN